jgi:hypothetical protein
MKPLCTIKKSHLYYDSQVPFKKIFVIFVVLGLELKGYTLNHSTSPFSVMGFSERGSHKLFAQAGFKQRSSC